MTPLEVFDRARRQTFMGLWEAGVALRGFVALAPLPQDHGFPEDILAPFRAASPWGGVVPLDFNPAWPMSLVEDAGGLAADFMFGSRRCGCRLPWRSVLRIEVIGVGAVHFETMGMDAPAEALGVVRAPERPSVEHEGNVARVDFGKGRRLRPVEG